MPGRYRWKFLRDQLSEMDIPQHASGKMDGPAFLYAILSDVRTNADARPTLLYILDI
jgi:hypothetical protein